MRGNTLVYRSADGARKLMQLTAVALDPVTHCSVFCFHDFLLHQVTVQSKLKTWILLVLDNNVFDQQNAQAFFCTMLSPWIMSLLTGW